MSRSTRIADSPVGSMVICRPSRSRAAGVAFCTVSMTWNSGWRASDRSGASTSTSRSNGTSWCSSAASAGLAHPASSSANDGSPDRSVRITSVLTKNPTRSSSASSVRPATGRPDRDVGPRAEPGQQHRQRGLHHHEHRHAVLPGQRGQRRRASAGTCSGTVCPRWLGTAGRAGRPAAASSCGAPGQRLPPARHLPGQHAVRVVLVARAAPAATARSPRTAPAAAPTPAPARAPRRVGHRDIPRQRPHRPAIRRDVVDHHHQHVLPRPGASSRARTGTSAARSNGSPVSRPDLPGELVLGDATTSSTSAAVGYGDDLLVRARPARGEHASAAPRGGRAHRRARPAARRCPA